MSREGAVVELAVPAEWLIKSGSDGQLLALTMGSVLSLAARFPCERPLYTSKVQINALGNVGQEYVVQIWTPSGRCCISVYFDSGKVQLGGTRPAEGKQFIEDWATPDNAVPWRARKQTVAHDIPSPNT